MAERKKPLSLPPLTLLALNSKKEEQILKIKILLAGLKHMTSDDKEYIYAQLSHIRVSNLIYSDIFTLRDRPIIFVYSIDIDGITVNINMAFYKSTGASRMTGLENTWLPTLGVDIESKTIIKLEEYYMHKYHNPYKIEYESNIEEIERLLRYKRFIDRENALASLYLSGFPRDIIEPVVSIDYINPTDKTYEPYIQREIKRYNKP
jgi:hypothetical protein